MIYLIISILIASSLFVIFKLFATFKINTAQAIVVNYLIAFLFGFYNSETSTTLLQIPQKSWFIGAFILGILFIAIFNVMGITAQKNGLAVASVAGKMSVTIPIIFGVFLYDESIGLIKIIGVLLALTSVYLASAKSDTASVNLKDLKYPILLFLGSGCIDTLLKYMEISYVSKSAIPMFLATIFGCAFIFGCFFMALQVLKASILDKKIKSIQRKQEEGKQIIKNIIGGIVLGIPNYYSMAFLIKALKTEGLESSTLFTINNVSVVILTTIFALLFFKEKLVKKNWIGIGLAVISILVVASA
ncbi:EamA family transporter [Tenacibaculum finnmarkense genomovar finnmarkense]|uniref:EamA family transporter n=1 Tax=Tenacibaculum finnmarkense TaxID=2781243 RepID=UPI001E64EBDC|nr:EamA family transporter [Tenacibaculum finnmarkense]MCD8417598.1 EamA family transporter [Tenacibaculum finnmarkense genomovar finnmarkense]MCG8185963.1 EamA family transporter [Tenacibaculum finnmarkense genomovar finnmarkense]MCG8202537.1 EamA family transporter [Tenacibaculum finnmarkense genomovar finnmarkense]MCG8209804.1 EamA family transporter [Tenacibaculum finnmarkense genomovar finnmarkense]MCG8212738.1 EamA family transporter [Tenacibaculum finnmarkense genomovar finnmarkense]